MKMHIALTFGIWPFVLEHSERKFYNLEKGHHHAIAEKGLPDKPNFYPRALILNATLNPFAVV